MNCSCLQGVLAGILFDANEGLFDGRAGSRRSGAFVAKLVKSFGGLGNAAESVLAAFASQKRRGVSRLRKRWGRKAWEVRKPGPVRFRAAIIYLAPQLLVASSDQPERARLRAAIYVPASRRMSFCLFLLQVGFT